MIINMTSMVRYNVTGPSPHDIYWERVGKATPEDIADIQEQLSMTANDPNMTIVCNSFTYSL